MEKNFLQKFFQSRVLTTSLLNIGIFLVYIAGGKFGLSLASVNPSATAIWPPTGIALASLLIFGYRVLPAIFLGAFFVNITTTGGVVTSLFIAGGNSLEAFVGAFLIKRFANGVGVFEHVGNIYKYIVAAILSTALSADVGVLTLIFGHLTSVKDFWSVWVTWWLGDIGGSLIVAPLLLVWAEHPRIHFNVRGMIHFLAAFVSTIVITHFVFIGVIPYVYLCIPLGVWIAFWFGRRGATVTTVVVAAIAIAYTLNGTGPFIREATINQSLILLQMFLSIFSLTNLTFAATVLEFRKSESVVASQEKRFQSLLEKSFDAFVLIDPTSKIGYASPSVKRLLGYTPEELVGTIGFNLVVEEDRPKTMKELASLVLKPGGTVTIEYRTQRKDKQIIWIEATGTNLLLDPKVNAIVVNFRDITEKKYHEEEVKNNEKRFRSLVENTGEGIALIDKNGKIIYTTATVTELLGYSQEEYEKKDPASVMHPDDRATVQEQSKKILNKPGSSVSLQYRVKHKNGTYRWFDVLATNLLDDEAVHAYVIKFRDITDQKNIQEEVRKEKIEDEAMLGSIGDGIIATDNKGVITMINKRGTDMLGWTEKELVGQNIATVIPLEDELGARLKVDERPVTKVLSLGKPIITSSTIFYVRKDGTKFPVHFTITPIILDKQILGAIEVFHDITQEKAVDKAKSEFVSVASHQLRTPLATINWYLEELIKNAANMTDKQTSYLKEVYSASKRMVDLINALLNASRLELGTFIVEPGSVQIPDVIKEVLKDLKPKIEQKHIKITEKYDAKLPAMNADPKLLTIIVQNLLGNALKYTKDSDTIFVTVTHTKEEFQLSVAEHGYGIPKSQQEKIFTKLFRADNARQMEPEGTGLGLYIVHTIVTTTGGKIWFESEENKGTTFYVSFPLSGMKQKKGLKQLI